MNSLLLVAALTTGQWVPDSEQRRFDDLWRQTGLEKIDGLKAYSHKAVGQRIVTVNSVVSNGIYEQYYEPERNSNAFVPWTTPAGLHLSPKSQWTKMTAAYIPSKVQVYRENVQVLNGFTPTSTQTQKRLSWAYPDKTTFVELLVRRYPDSSEHPFEVRQRTKIDGKWQEGDTYRPYATANDLPFGSEKETWWYSAHKLSDFGIVKFENVSTYKLPKLTNLMPRLGKFKLSRVVATADHDDAPVPKNYAGTLTTNCMACHSLAGSPTSYGVSAIRGSDSILSFSVFTDDTINSDEHPYLDGRIAEFRKR